MLVLSRKLGERIIIDEKIVVTVIGVSGDRVRLGIAAPAEVSVHRQEVAERIERRERSRRESGKSTLFADCA